jgi:hypothetical protein
MTRLDLFLLDLLERSIECSALAQRRTLRGDARAAAWPEGGFRRHGFPAETGFLVGGRRPLAAPGRGKETPG